MLKLLIQSKAYLKGALNLWNHTNESTFHDDIDLCSLGGLTNHMSSLMVNLSYHITVAINDFHF